MIPRILSFILVCFLPVPKKINFEVLQVRFGPWTAVCERLSAGIKRPVESLL